MIGEKELRMMKKTAILINTARGQIIDQKALVEALKEKIISIAALDVLEKEPPDYNDPILTLDNVILSGHNGSVTEEAFHRVWIACTKAIIDVFNERAPQPPANVVNREVISYLNLKS
jgi:D-3-phosphoglycerate dehydrogenase